MRSSGGAGGKRIRLLGEVDGGDVRGALWLRVGLVLRRAVRVPVRALAVPAGAVAADLEDAPPLPLALAGVVRLLVAPRRGFGLVVWVASVGLATFSLGTGATASALAVACRPLTRAEALVPKSLLAAASAVVRTLRIQCSRSSWRW